LREANTRNKTLKKPITQRSKPVLKQASGKANTQSSKKQEKPTLRESSSQRSNRREASLYDIKNRKLRETSIEREIREASIERSNTRSKNQEKQALREASI
jgi:hypothetical protein